MVNVNRLPKKLKEEGLFCVHREKVPYNPCTGGKAQPNNPATFAPLHIAEAEQSKYDGMGVGIFGNVCAIDIDHCIDENGNLSAMCADIITIMDAYTEFSPSGSGIRILFSAPDLDYDKKKYYINNQKIGLEVYVAGATNKYVTVTGNTLTPGADMEERGEQLQIILDKYMKRPEKPQTREPVTMTNLDDADIIARAHAATNGADFGRLWNGDTSGHGSDDSAADLALCNHLAFWTQCDAGQMDRLFRCSRLMREKWDRPQSGSTYGKITMQKSIDDCKKVYDPGYRSAPSRPAASGNCEEIRSSAEGYEEARISIDVVKSALKDLGFTVRQNVLLKEVEIKGLPAQYSTGNAANVLPALLKDHLRAAKVKGVTSPGIDEYLACIADENRFNPIEEMLEGTRWDGVDRISEIYDILGVTIDRHKSYIKKWLIQCIALGLNDDEDPTGAEGVLVLQGEQGLAKTSFFRAITPNKRWFAEGAVIDVSDKDTTLKATGAWITELGELDSTLKREQSALKAFITSTEDNIRVPYAKLSTRTPRRTSFCGTVNPTDYLRDETGSRRFWTVPVTCIDKKRLFSLPRGWAAQLWAQTFTLYKTDRQGFRLTDDEMTQLQADNGRFTIALPFELEIKELFDYSLPFDECEWWTAKEIRAFLPPNAEARQVGKALKKVVDEWYGVHFFNAPHTPQSTKRTGGIAHYFIPMKKNSRREV